MIAKNEHWDSIFAKTEDMELGWYERDNFQTHKLLNRIPDWQNATILLPGVGTSTIIEDLLSAGCRLMLNDLSLEALARVKKRLRSGKEKIMWLPHDISRPFKTSVPDIDIWIDRAVLHFLIDKKEIAGYFDNLRFALHREGYGLFAQFSTSGAQKCAGLEVCRYTAEMLAENLGPDFHLIAHFDYTYINPSGDPRPYIYALFKRGPV